MIAALLALCVAAPGDIVLEKAALIKRNKELMHTKLTLAISGVKPGEDIDEAFTAVWAIFDHIDRVMNEWKDDSALGRINAGAGVETVDAPADLCEVVKLALDGAKRTNGLFDPTWAALRDVWKFTGSVEQSVPDAATVKAACALVSYKDVELKPKPDGTCTVKLKKKGMALGLGGIVKGWGVDQAVKELKKRGYQDFFVQAGGDLYLSGSNGDRSWKVGIREPRGEPEATFARGELADHAFSTSGDYEHYFTNGGKRYHHLIDPRSCMPATASVSSTVAAKTAVDAEILTKATFILGGQKALELAKSFGAQAVLVDAQGKVKMSKDLEGKLRVTSPTGFGQ